MTVLEPRKVSKPARWRARAARVAAVFGVLSSACQGLLGGVELADPPAEPSASGAAGARGELPRVFPPLLPEPNLPAPSRPGPSEGPGSDTPLVPPGGPAADAGVGGSADAASPPPPPRPVDVEPPSPLGLVGFTGGGPRLGTCQGGVLIGARTTANPNTDGFGQRLVFVEPICAGVTLLPEPSGARIALTRDDALLNWDATEPMLGPPSWEVPDERLVWVPQPETLCPAAAPALIGLTGEYDPAADDGSVTATIRSLVLECAPLALAENGRDVMAAADGHLLISRPDSFAATGSAQYRSTCEGGTVLSQLLIHSGFWLDGFVLGCSSLHGAE